MCRASTGLFEKQKNKLSRANKDVDCVWDENHISPLENSLKVNGIVDKLLKIFVIERVVR